MTDEEFKAEQVKLQKWMSDNKQIVDNMPLWNQPGPAPAHVNKVMALLINDKAMYEANSD